MGGAAANLPERPAPLLPPPRPDCYRARHEVGTGTGRLAGSAGGREERTIILFGLYRGGTTMLARVVRILGVHLADRAHVFAEGKTNEEDVEFQGVDLDTLVRVARKRDAERRVWGFKDPLSTRRLDDLVGVLRNPCFIGITRDPFAAAQTELRERGAFDPLVSMTQKLDDLTRMLAFAMRARREGIPLYLLSYERCLRMPAETVDGVAAFLGLEVDEQTRSEAIASIDPAKGYALTEEELRALGGGDADG